MKAEWFYELFLYESISLIIQLKQWYDGTQIEAWFCIYVINASCNGLAPIRPEPVLIYHQLDP